MCQATIVYFLRGESCYTLNTLWWWVDSESLVIESDIRICASQRLPATIMLYCPYRIDVETFFLSLKVQCWSYILSIHTVCTIKNRQITFLIHSPVFDRSPRSSLMHKLKRISRSLTTQLCWQFQSWWVWKQVWIFHNFRSTSLEVNLNKHGWMFVFTI